MLDDGILEIYERIPGKTESGVPTSTLKPYKKAWYGDIDFQVGEYYSDKQAQAKAERRVRIHQDKAVCNLHVIAIAGKQYDVGRTYSTLAEGIPITDITLERTAKNYDIG